MNDYEIWQTPEWQRKAGFAVPGGQVTYLNTGGYDSSRASALRAGLVEGGTYVVTATEVGRSSSDYKLEGFPYSFNTVMFKVAK
jgi:hypothetical protein